MIFDELVRSFFAIRLGTHYGIPLADSQSALTYISYLSSWYIQRYANLRDARA